jgi:hypothetical protein
VHARAGEAGHKQVVHQHLVCRYVLVDDRGLAWFAAVQVVNS